MAENWKIDYVRLASMTDSEPSLWGARESTMSGVNDCISAEVAARYDHSLLLIKPAHLVIRVGFEGSMNRDRAVRAYFTYGAMQYALKVTDPVAKVAFRQKEDGQYPLDAYLCVSLTDPYEKDKRCHKLAAAIIVDKPILREVE